jgi:hypothetical protein
MSKCHYCKVPNEKGNPTYNLIVPASPDEKRIVLQKVNCNHLTSNRDFFVE